MLPIVVAGGLCIALSFVFGIEAFKQEGTLAAALMAIGGGAAFKLMVPILSGYIAYSIADRPGLTPGLVGGMLAVNLEAGFLGGIVSGFLAGYIALWIRDRGQCASALRGPETGTDHSAALDPGGRAADDLRGRRPGEGDHGRADPLPAGHEFHQRGLSRSDARRHDGGGHGWTGEQGRLHLRGGAADQRHLPADGGGHGGRHDPAARASPSPP